MGRRRRPRHRDDRRSRRRLGRRRHGTRRTYAAVYRSFADFLGPHAGPEELTPAAVRACPGHASFDFLGYTFRPRLSKSRFGKHFVDFSAAVSGEAKMRMRREMRRWRLHLRRDKALTDLARMFNAVLQGWINYHGRFYKSMLYPVFRHLNESSLCASVGLAVDGSRSRM